MESEDTVEEAWADGVDAVLFKLDKDLKTVKIGVVIGIGAGAGGIAMALILGKTVAKLAEGMNGIGQLTQAMMVQLNPGMAQGPQPGYQVVDQERFDNVMGGTPGPDVPAPSTEGSVRSFLAPRGKVPDESIRTGDDALEAIAGPESSIPDWAKEAMADDHIDLNGAAPDAGTAGLPGPDVPPPSSEGAVRSVVKPRVPPAGE